MIQYIEGKMLRDMFVSGANNLQNHKDLVDKLNVFPVPDGDTGTNMSLTISYAMKELSKVENDNITDIGKSLSKGSLMGARGNSGVILSQIIRGFSKSIEGKDKITTEEIEFACIFMFNGALGIINYWIKNDFNGDIEEIAKNIETLGYFGTNKYIYKK